MKPIPEKQYSLRIFTCSYMSDLLKFRDLVLSKKGLYQGDLVIDGINIWHEPVIKQYMCAYYYFEDLDMEVKC